MSHFFVLIIVLVPTALHVAKTHEKYIPNCRFANSLIFTHLPCLTQVLLLLLVAERTLVNPSYYYSPPIQSAHDYWDSGMIKNNSISILCANERESIIIIIMYARKITPVDS